MKRVLVVEDHWMTVDNLVAICREAGCEVKVAMSLAEVEAMAKEKFDIFVWDYNLPDGTTLEAIKVARKRDSEATMIASSSDPESRLLQVIAGCNIEVDPYSIYGVLEKEVEK
ncbi:MAG: response regulator [Parcubacteria group bacterium]|jgi:DNA-binding response OmpR family regulator